MDKYTYFRSVFTTPSNIQDWACLKGQSKAQSILLITDVLLGSKDVSMLYKAHLSNKWGSTNEMSFALAHKKCQRKNEIKIVKNS